MVKNDMKMISHFNCIDKNDILTCGISAFFIDLLPLGIPRNLIDNKVHFHLQQQSATMNSSVYGAR